MSDRPRKGEHRFHIAFANAAGIAHCTGVLAKGRRDRAAEEDLVARAIVLWLARGCGVAAPSPRSLLDADEHFAETVVATEDTLEQLLAGEFVASPPSPTARYAVGAAAALGFAWFVQPGARRACVAGARRRRAQAAASGVRNLRHQRGQAAALGRRCGTASRNSPGRRRSRSRARPPSSKSRASFRRPFLSSAWTPRSGWSRRRYYGDDELRMHVALEEIASGGASFLVAVRIDATARVRTLRDVPVPRRYIDLFSEIPEHRFRFDTSSSEIRADARSSDLSSIHCREQEADPGCGRRSEIVRNVQLAAQTARDVTNNISGVGASAERVWSWDRRGAALSRQRVPPGPTNYRRGRNVRCQRARRVKHRC